MNQKFVVLAVCSAVSVGPFVACVAVEAEVGQSFAMRPHMGAAAAALASLAGTH